MNRVFELTRSLVNIESISNNETQVASFLFDHLSRIAAHSGGHVERMLVEGERFNVFAFWGHPAVTLSTHMDTVPPFFPSREDDSWIWGRRSHNGQKSHPHHDQRLHQTPKLASPLELPSAEIRHLGKCGHNKTSTELKLCADKPTLLENARVESSCAHKLSGLKISKATKNGMVDPQVNWDTTSRCSTPLDFF